MIKVVKNDDELLLLLKQDNADAFEEIFNRYWKKLYALAFNRLRSKVAAEDVVQDVLVSLWTRRHDLEVANLGHYLGTAVRYAVFRQFNNLPAGTHIDIVDLQLESPRADANVFELMDYHILEKYLDEELAKLPDKCQVVFRYSREAQLSNKEIADKLQLSEKTIEAHITKALKHLRVAMKGFFFLIFVFFQ